MSAVIESLRKLEQSVLGLEASVGGMEGRIDTQRDMFGGPDVALDANGTPKSAIVSDIPEAEVIAKRLDFAITKVEELLQEDA